MRVGPWDLREKGREVIRREVACKVIHFCVNIGGVDVKLKMGFNKDHVTKHVHNALVFAHSRPQACHNHLIVTVQITPLMKKALKGLKAVEFVCW